MFKRAYAPASPWHTRTMSYMINEDLFQIDKWLNSVQPFSLFTRGCTEASFYSLWNYSFDHIEHPYALPERNHEKYQDLILDRLPREVDFISFPEFALLQRLMQGEGTVSLFSRLELPACKSLVQRMWAQAVVNADGTISVSIPELILSDISSHMEEESFLLNRYLLSDFIHQTEHFLQQQGLVPGDLAMNALVQKLGRIPAEDTDLCLRLLKLTFDYTLFNDQLIFLHPAVYDPSCFFAKLDAYPGDIYEKPIEELTLMMDSPDNICQLMSSALQFAIRTDVPPEEIANDLYYLARQDVPFEGLLDALKPSLAVRPAKEILDSLHLLKSHVPVWPLFRNGVGN